VWVLFPTHPPPPHFLGGEGGSHRSVPRLRRVIYSFDVAAGGGIADARLGLGTAAISTRTVEHVARSTQEALARGRRRRH